MPALFAAQPGKSSGLIVSCSPCCLCPPSLHFPRTCSMSSLFAASGSHSLSCTTLHPARRSNELVCSELLRFDGCHLVVLALEFCGRRNKIQAAPVLRSDAWRRSDGQPEALRPQDACSSKGARRANSRLREWLTDDYSVVRRVLFDHHPLEPKMWLGLSGAWFLQFSFGEILVDLFAPWPGMEERPAGGKVGTCRRNCPVAPAEVEKGLRKLATPTQMRRPKTFSRSLR